MRQLPLNRIVPLLLFTLALLALGNPSAHAQDSGLDGHRYRIGFGLSPLVTDQNDYHSDLSPSGSSSEFLAADYTFFRPTRQEALATLWYVHGKYNINGQAGTASLGAATAEYRWRFFGNGITYVALGAGLSSSDLQTGGVKIATTIGFGVDLGHFYVSERLLGMTWSVAALFFGVRF